MTADARLGTSLAGYRLLALLGRGGMSVVYLAEEARPRRKVALKLLAPELAQRETFRQRFLREQELAASIDHPNVLPVYDAGEADGVLWLAMRYVDGMDLRALLAGKGPLPPAQALEIVTQVADALDAAHERGLVHRDVKPGNILLAPAGGGGAEHAYLADFGLTRRADDASELTGSGQVLGTVDYVAPEQVEGGSVDGRADQYALACVLFECLTGVVPFRRSTELAVLWAHVHHRPPRLEELRSGLPAALDGVLARGLAKAPADRYSTCASLATAARDALDPGGTAAAASAAPPRVPASRRLLPALVRRAGRLLPVVALVALAGATTIAGLLLRDAGGGRAGLRLPIVTPDTAVRIDAASGNVVATVKVGATPSAVAVGGGLVWVANARDATVSEIDPATNRVQGTVHLPGSAPAGEGGLGMTYGDDTAWVVDRDDGTVTRIDPNADAASPIRVAGRPSSVAVGTDAAWITDQADGRAVRFDVGRNEVVARVPVGPAPVGVTLAPDGSTVWVVNHGDNTVTKLDGRANRGVRRIKLPVVADQAVFGGDAVWVTSSAANTVLRISAASGAIRRILVGDGPTAIAFGAGRVWLANTRDGTISSIDPNPDATGSYVVGTYRLGFHPTAVAVDQESVWATVA